MKRVLQVLGTTNLGGAESRVMDLYRHMNREEIQFDFLVHRHNGYFEKEIREMGGNIYYLPSFRMYNYFAYKRACREFFEKHHDYLAVHGHMTSTASIYLPVAKKCGVPLTIAHARSAGVDPGLKGLATRFLRRNLWKKCDVAIACSNLAGKAVFGNHPFQFMPNAVDTKLFQKDKEAGNEIRRRYGLEHSLVIGHVGRFDYAKNHEFLLEIFRKILMKKPESSPRLLLLGEGGRMENMKQQARQTGIEKSVIFAGNQSPVAPFYQAMDAFVFPSRFEGMPGTVVEAQAAGLPCFVSDAVTRQVKISEPVYFLSISESPEKWADCILEKYQEEKKEITDLSKTDYDVNQQVQYYRSLYLNQKGN